MKSILEVTHLKKKISHFCLDDVSFSLPEGCITGFIGVNGSGKTTTIKTILGLYIKDSGNIQFFGKESKGEGQEEKSRIGVVLDEGYFYEGLTLKEMKSVIAPAYKNWDDEVFFTYMKRFGLDVNQKIANLSKGMRMKYGIALALSHHADLLIMDEPTSGLDPLIRSELMDILLEFMREDGKSVFFSTHVTSDLDKVADVIILIERGKIILNESKDELLDRHAVVKGDNRLIDERTKPLFLHLHQTAFGFEGLTDRKEAIRQIMKDAVMERPSIEQVMLAYVGSDYNDY